MIYIQDFITEDEEKGLLSIIDKQPWNMALKRRTQHYGFVYDYSGRALSKDDDAPPVPDWADFVIARLEEKGYFQSGVEQMIVNEYLPGQGIGDHVDSPVFGPEVASLSLGGGCLMDIISVCGIYGSKSQYLWPRSMLILKDEWRYDYRHGIAQRAYDVVFEEGKPPRNIPRRRRVSLTFRTRA